MPTVVVSLSAILLLSACGHKQPQVSLPATTSTGDTPSISGEWSLHMGQAMDTLSLTDKNGVITGTITKDSRWGGATMNIAGARVDNQVDFSYFSDADKTEYSFKGSVADDKMSGTVRVILRDDTLWVADKIK